MFSFTKSKIDIPSEEFTPSTIKQLLLYMVRPYRLRLFWFFLTSFVGIFFWVASTFVASKLISELGGNSTVDSRIYWLVFWFGFMRIADEIFWRIAELVMLTIKPQMVERVRAALYRSTLDKPHSFFVDANSGRIAHWVNEATTTTNGFIDITIWTVWGRVVGMILSTVFLFTAHWSLALLFVGWLVILFAYNAKRGKKFGDLVEEQSDEASVASGIIVDTVANNLSMRVFVSQQAETERLDRQQKRVIKKWRQSWIHNTKTNVVKGQSAAIVNILALVMALALFKAGTMELGGLVLFMAYFTDASGSLWQLAWSLDTYYRQFGTLRNALEGLSGNSERKGKVIAKKDLPSEVSIELKNLSFAYPEQPKLKILKGINLDIKSGEKIGIVGHSGAGKSTLLGLLLGFYEPTGGAIIVSGVDVMSVDPTYVRNVSAFVPQDTGLFNRNILENVRYAKPAASKKEIEQALEKARALDFVNKLPEKMDTLVGERGVKLSGGQRQRLAIARAILKDAPLLLLDEATSALDSVSEQQIQKALHDLMQDRTAVIIAHRLSTLRHLDRIIVMEDGKIVQNGPHDELLKDKKGVYADLWKRQKDGFIVE